MQGGEMGMEMIEEELMILDQGIKESYYQQMKEVQFVETCRIFIPFESNSLKLLMIEVNPMSSSNLLYFSEGVEMSEEMMEGLESLMMIMV